MADLAATNSLRCEGLGKRFGGVVALAGVTTVAGDPGAVAGIAAKASVKVTDIVQSLFTV